MKHKNWKFDCPRCKSEQSFLKEGGLFWCEGCNGLLQVKIGKSTRTTSSVETIRKAIEDERLILG